MCKVHGGSAPQVKAAAKRNVEEEQLRKKLGRLTSIPVTNPLAKLQELAGKADAWMVVCEEHMAELERLRYSSAEGGEHIRGEVVLFERAMEACRKILVDSARLNIDERLSAITARNVAQAWQLVVATERRLGRDPSDPAVLVAFQASLAEMGASQLMALEGEAA